MSVLKPKKPVWLYASLGVGVLSVLVFLLLSRREPWNAGRAGGLVFGIAASVLFLIDLLYPLRRRLFGHCKIVCGVLPPHVLLLAVCRQALQPKLADRLQHRQARLWTPRLQVVQLLLT